MSSRDDADAFVETIDEPPIGGAGCPETSSLAPSAVRIAGVPFDARPGAQLSEVVGAGERSTRAREDEEKDGSPLLRVGEPMSCAPTAQTMDAEPETFTMDPLYAFYRSESSPMNWLYNCWWCPVCAHGDVVVAHEIAQMTAGTFDTPAGQTFQRKNDITCLPGCWKPALAMSACALLSSVAQVAYPLTATSSIACENFHHVLSIFSTASIAYFGGSNRRRIMDAHRIREPPCHLGCCTLQPPFNPYVCWFCCPSCASAQEHKIMLRVLRSRARDVAYEQL